MKSLLLGACLALGAASAVAQSNMTVTIIPQNGMVSQADVDRMNHEMEVNSPKNLARWQAQTDEMYAHAQDQIDHMVDREMARMPYPYGSK